MTTHTSKDKTHANIVDLSPLCYREYKHMQGRDLKLPEEKQGELTQLIN